MQAACSKTCPCTGAYTSQTCIHGARDRIRVKTSDLPSHKLGQTLWKRGNDRAFGPSSPGFEVAAVVEDANSDAGLPADTLSHAQSRKAPAAILDSWNMTWFVEACCGCFSAVLLSSAEEARDDLQQYAQATLDLWANASRFRDCKSGRSGGREVRNLGPSSLRPPW